MNRREPDRWAWGLWVPAPVMVAGAVLLLALDLTHQQEPRIPETRAGGEHDGEHRGQELVELAETIPGPGRPGRDLGSWSQFRGLDQSGQVASDAGLLRSWPQTGPKVLWQTEVGEGHAGAAVRDGRVYLVDYDREHERDSVRCLSLDDGREIWRFSYPVRIKRNHGMSRTIPAVTDDLVISLGPKCHLSCVRAETGELVWFRDLVAENGTTVPPWYAGQCPVLDQGSLVIAPGADPLMMKMDPADGRVLWETPNPGGWAMTHSSVLVLDHPARRQYVYCTTRGVVGVAADNGELLWTKPDWKISIANIPTPVALSPDTVLFTGGYNAGAAVVRIAFENGAFRAVEEDRLEPRLLGSDQQTPLVRDRTVYCVMPSPRGELAVVGPGGVCAWSSGSDRTFGLGPYLMAGSLLYVLSDRAGELFLFEMTETAGRELARAGVLDGHDAWAPMALVGGRLLLRDLTVLKCLEVGESAPPTRQ